MDRFVGMLIVYFDDGFVVCTNEGFTFPAALQCAVPSVVMVAAGVVQIEFLVFVNQAPFHIFRIVYQVYCNEIYSFNISCPMRKSSYST